MPKTELHNKKLKKNLLALAMIFGFCALIWSITIIRISGQTAEERAAAAAVTAPENAHAPEAMQPAEEGAMTGNAAAAGVPQGQ